MGERDVQRLFKPQGLKTPTVVLVMETFYMYQKIGKVIRYKKLSTPNSLLVMNELLFLL